MKNGAITLFCDFVRQGKSAVCPGKTVKRDGSRSNVGEPTTTLITFQRSYFDLEKGKVDRKIENYNTNFYQLNILQKYNQCSKIKI